MSLLRTQVRRQAITFLPQNSGFAITLEDSAESVVLMGLRKTENKHRMWRKAGINSH